MFYKFYTDIFCTVFVVYCWSIVIILSYISDRTSLYFVFFFYCYQLIFVLFSSMYMYDRLALLFVVCKDCYQILSRVMPWLQLRFDYDPTTTYRARLLPFDAIRREQKINMSVFRRSRIIVVSQSNRTQIIISITFVVVECVVISSSNWGVKLSFAYITSFLIYQPRWHLQTRISRQTVQTLNFDLLL